MIVICLFPATVFQVRQFTEREAIIADEARIIANLLGSSNFTPATNGDYRSALTYLISEVLTRDAQIILVDSQNQVLVEIGTPIPNPKVTVTVPAVGGSLNIHTSISDRVPVMVTVFSLAVTLMLIILLILHRFVFMRWEKSMAAESQSKKMLNDIVNVASDWFWEADHNGVIRFINDNGTQQPVVQHFLGKSLWQLPGTLMDASAFELEQRFAERADMVFSTCCQNLGEKCCFDIRGMAIYDDNKQFIGYRGAGLDTTEARSNASRVQQLQEVVVQALGSLAETRDNDTGYHIIRTKIYVRRLAEQLRTHGCYSDLINDDYIHLLYLSAPLHDIGKVGIPDRILCKPGPLTSDEFEIMKTHTTLGYEALVRAEQALDFKLDFLQHAKDITLYHQEKWDGSGYPHGLTGHTIPLSARIMAVADVYDALTTKRVYKDAMSHEQAVDIITTGKGSHFDPLIIESFVSIADELKQISQQYRDSEHNTPHLIEVTG